MEIEPDENEEMDIIEPDENNEMDIVPEEMNIEVECGISGRNGA